MWNTVSCSRLPSLKRQGSPRKNPAEGDKDGKEPGASPIRGKAERPASVKPREEKAEVILSMFINI